MAGIKAPADLFKQFIDSLSGGLNSRMGGYRDIGIVHRSAVTAVDKLTTLTLVTAADQAGVVGVMANAEHKVAVAPGNVYGVCEASNILTVTPTLNKTVDLTVPQCAGATYYDIFFSTDAAPKWVGRITEAQRVSGIAITAVGTTAAGGSAGKVNIRLVGTGLATTAPPFAANTAYLPTLTPTAAVSCIGKSVAIVNIALTCTDFRSLPTFSFIPFYKTNSLTDASWFAGAVQAVAPVSAIAKPMYVSYALDVRSAKSMVVVCDVISGQGTSAKVTIDLY